MANTKNVTRHMCALTVFSEWFLSFFPFRLFYLFFGHPFREHMINALSSGHVFRLQPTHTVGKNVDRVTRNACTRFASEVAAYPSAEDGRALNSFRVDVLCAAMQCS